MVFLKGMHCPLVEWTEGIHLKYLRKWSALHNQIEPSLKYKHTFDQYDLRIWKLTQV